jgi:acyl-[acyl carrier protein]--UDP-N-acetylglucosamine O-acyltransferase
MIQIHPTAIVEEGAVIADGCVIGPIAASERMWCWELVTI